MNKFILQESSILLEASLNPADKSKYGTNTPTQRDKANPSDLILWDPEEEYKKASGVNINSFWKLYFQKCWGENADVVERLGEAFKKELIKLGFTTETNAFIAFLKNILLADSGELANIKKILVSSKGVESYNAIHNAYIDKAVTDSMLYMESDDSLNIDPAHNILYAGVGLYRISGTEATNYLKLQKQLAKYAWPTTGDSLQAKVYESNFNSNLKNAILSVFFNFERNVDPYRLYKDGEKANYLIAADSADPDKARHIAPASLPPLEVLRPYTTAKAITQQIMGDSYVSDDTKINPEKAGIKTKLKQFISTTEDAFKTIKFLIWNSDTADLADVLKMIKKVPVALIDGTAKTANIEKISNEAGFPDGGKMKEIADALKAYKLNKQNRVNVVISAIIEKLIWTGGAGDARGLAYTGPWITLADAS